MAFGPARADGDASPADTTDSAASPALERGHDSSATSPNHARHQTSDHCHETLHPSHQPKSNPSNKTKSDPEETTADLKGTADGEAPTEDSNLASQKPSENNAAQPPLPNEELPPPLPDEAPPLPDEAPPGSSQGAPGQEDGWEPLWDDHAQAYYFHNKFTGKTQWENPRVPDASAQGPTGVASTLPPTYEGAPGTEPPPKPLHGGYNPAIHGSYDPTADYAREAAQAEDQSMTATGGVGMAGVAGDYAATGQFNRFTGRWQAADQNPELHNDENKSRRQMGAFFDVDAAANSHNGRSLKAERSGKKLTKQELKAFKEKRRDRKEEKRRAWLRD